MRTSTPPPEPPSVVDVQQVFRSVFDNETLVINRGMTSHDVEGWDSLSNMLLLSAIEEKWGVTFKASEISKLSNVGELLDLLQTKFSK